MTTKIILTAHEAAEILVRAMAAKHAPNANEAQIKYSYNDAHLLEKIEITYTEENNGRTDGK